MRKIYEVACMMESMCMCMYMFCAVNFSVRVPSRA